MRVTVKKCIFDRLKLSLSNTISRQISNTSYSVVKPGNVSPSRSVPAHIKKPPYAETGKALCLHKSFVKEDDLDFLEQYDDLT